MTKLHSVILPPTGWTVAEVFDELQSWGSDDDPDAEPKQKLINWITDGTSLEPAGCRVRVDGPDGKVQDAAFVFVEVGEDGLTDEDVRSLMDKFGVEFAKDAEGNELRNLTASQARRVRADEPEPTEE